MTNLWFQSRYTDESDEPQTCTTPQGPQQRPDDVLEVHGEELEDLEDEHHIGDEDPPEVLLIPVEATAPRADSYVGVDGMRHGAIVQPATGESPAECNARLAAAILLMKTKYPAA